MNQDSIDEYNRVIGSTDYSDLVYYRDELVDGIKPCAKGWMWPKTDHGVWEPVNNSYQFEFKDRYLSYTRDRRVMVQAGGAGGVYPRLMSEIFETVYTFEPFPLMFHCLVNNCQKANIIKFNACLGSSAKMVDFSHFYEGNYGMNKVGEDSGRVPRMTIDSLNLNACDFIQLDVEGDELEALIGAVKTIEKFKPAISTENNRPGEVDDFLAQRGYTKMYGGGSDSFYMVER